MRDGNGVESIGENRRPFLPMFFALQSARVSGLFEESFARGGLNDAAKRLDAFGKSLQGIGTKMAMLGAGIATPLAGAAKVFADMGSDMVDMSQRTGVSVEALSELGFTDSKNEREFVRELDSSIEVVVYAKLPKSFYIPTPVGNYSPDWAIAFQEGKVKHLYFVAETKGSMSSMELRKIEECKIDCARSFFKAITSDQVKYDVVNSYSKLMELIT